MGCLCVCLSVCLSLCLCVCVYADRTLGATHRDQQVTEALCVYVIIFWGEGGGEKKKDVRSNPPGPGAYHVHKALEFFQWRADIRFGYFEGYCNC